MTSCVDVVASPDAAGPVAESTRPWMIAVTRVQREKDAETDLEERGFEVWLPLRRVTFTNARSRRSGRPSEERFYPAYPGYLFARERTALDWMGMLGAKTVRGVLKVERQGDRIPVRVSHAEITKLRSFLAPLAMPMVADALRIGDRVVVTEGPFMSFQGLVERLCSNQVVIEVDLFGRATPLRVEKAHTAVVPTAEPA